MPFKIPLVITQDKDLNLFQTQLGKALQPIISNAMLDGTMLNAIVLLAGVATVFPHNLNRLQMGWFLTDTNAASTVFRSAPFNSSTLTLTASNNTIVNIWCF